MRDQEWDRSFIHLHCLSAILLIYREILLGISSRYLTNVFFLSCTVVRILASSEHVSSSCVLAGIFAEVLVTYAFDLFFNYLLRIDVRFFDVFLTRDI